MYLQNGLHNASNGLGATCVVPAAVTIRKLRCDADDLTAIGAVAGRAVTVADVRTALRDAAQLAVKWLKDAAATLKRPRPAGVAGEPMRLRFQESFGTNPVFVPTWRPAGQKWDRGDIVRTRLLCAAKILAEGDIDFVCWGPRSCPFAFAWSDRTWAVVEHNRYRMCLGERFWKAWTDGDKEGMADTLLHECLHIYFDTIGDTPERGPYGVAACYSRFALLTNGIALPTYVQAVCRSNIPKGDYPVPRGDTRVAGLGWLGQPAVVPSCQPEPGEVVASRTAAGVLTKDVEVTGRGVLVTDFGIDRRSVKEGAKTELAPLLARLEGDPRIREIRITGFDDCIGPSALHHRLLRQARAIRIRNLLGPLARAKVKFVGPAPVGTFFGPNTDRAARARNRSVLIEFTSEITFEPDKPPKVKPCHEQLMRKAITQLDSDPSLDSVKSRLGAALGNSLVGRDDRFIRPGSTSMMFPFRWSGIKQYFTELCNQPGGAAGLTGAALRQKLTELDQDIVNGLESFKRARQQFSSVLNKKALLEAEFGRPLETLFKNKAQSAYAGY